jgi:hypothetical protein
MVYPSVFISTLSDRITKIITSCDNNTKQILPKIQEKIKKISQNVTFSLYIILTMCDNYT